MAAGTEVQAPPTMTREELVAEIERRLVDGELSQSTVLAEVYAFVIEFRSIVDVMQRNPLFRRAMRS